LSPSNKIAGMFAGALRAGREDGFVAGGLAMGAGFATVAFGSSAGFFSAGAEAGTATTDLGFATRFVLARGLATVFFFSKINSTPISGFSSAEGCGGSGSSFAFGFATAFSNTRGLNSPGEITFAADFAADRGPASSSGDFGAAFAVAEVLLGAADRGFVSGTGSAAAAGLAFTLRLMIAAAFGSGAGFGNTAGSIGVTRLTATAATLRVFFAAIFFTVFAGFAFEIFAPVLARLRVVRAGRGFAAAVFFGFFMTTILATECGCWWRVRPVFGWRNGYLIPAYNRVSSHARWHFTAD
jgi:hypothetical protein